MDKFLSFVEVNKVLILVILNMLAGSIGAYFIIHSFFNIHLKDNPNERSSHSYPIPRGAGIGILLAFLLSGMVLRIATTMIYAVIIVGAISFYEDHFATPIKFRLFLHFLAAIFFLIPYFTAIHNNLWMGFIIVGILLIYIVATTNVFNFMDGIDGIAGIAALIGFGLLWFNGYIVDKKLFIEHPSFVILAGCIAISCLGFLPLNFPRAKVFMGDVGSITLGFLFAGLVIYFSKSIRDFLCYSAFMILFYIDEIISVLLRIQRKQSLFIPHRGHLYQLLANEMQIPHWRISVGYGIAQIIIGMAIIVLKSKGYLPIILIWLGSFIGMAKLYKVVIRKSFAAKS